MDTETYEQIHLTEEALGDSVNYLLPESTIRWSSTERAGRHRAAADRRPEGGRHGARHQGRDGQRQVKPATLETGLVVNVPPFINRATSSASTPRPGEYLSRA
jgi:elongation factor P